MPTFSWNFHFGSRLPGLVYTQPHRRLQMCTVIDDDDTGLEFIQIQDQVSRDRGARPRHSPGIWRGTSTSPFPCLR